MSDTVKLYRKIADAVAGSIESGQYAIGDRLPTERELAEHFGVSHLRGRARRAVRTLRRAHPNPTPLPFPAPVLLQPARI